MPRHFDWNKAKMRELVWRKGALPYWWEGWKPEHRDSSGELKVERQIETAQPRSYVNLEFFGRPDVKICYAFSAMELSHEAPILNAARRLSENEQENFFLKFRELLEFDYSFHDEE